MATTRLRVGSRRSALALLQTNITIDLLEKLNIHIEFEIVEISTTGDKILDKELSKIGEKSLFTKELENSLLQCQVDFVVHSLKDMPTTLPPGLVLGCVFDRTDAEDVVLMCKKYRGYKLGDLPEGSVVGSGSLRRVASHTRNYPQLRFVPIRGNLNTRLTKLDHASASENTPASVFAQHYDAIILAKAGVQRLGWSHRIDQVLSDSLYAVSQGALTCECRKDDQTTLELLARLNDDFSAVTTVAERSLMRKLNGGCATPVGVRSRLTRTLDSSINPIELLSLEAEVMNLDGSQVVSSRHQVVLPGASQTEGQDSGTARSTGDSHSTFLGLDCSPSPYQKVTRERLAVAKALGQRLADELLTNGAASILNDIRANSVGKAAVL